LNTFNPLIKQSTNYWR